MKVWGQKINHFLGFDLAGPPVTLDIYTSCSHTWFLHTERQSCLWA